MKNLIIRKDLRNQPAVFDADTETDTGIKMWNGVHGSHMEDVSLAYYKSTVPLEDKEQVEKLIKGWTSNFGDREIMVRQRLIKRSAKAKEGETQTQPESIDKAKFKKDFLKAVEKMLEAI